MNGRGWLLTFAVLTPVLASADDAEKVSALVRDGRYAEAYDAGTGGATDTATLARFATILLNESMQNHEVDVRGPALRAAVVLNDPKLIDGARQAARSSDRYDQSIALEIIANIDPRAGREELLAALGSPYRSVRLRALQGLAKLQDPSLLERISAVLVADTDPDLRAFAARALGLIQTPEANAALYRGLDDPVGAVQEDVVRALVRLHDGAIAGTLRRQLAEEPAEAQLRTVRLMALVPDPQLVAPLGPLLAAPNPDMRAAAAAAIIAIVEPVPASAR